MKPISIDSGDILDIRARGQLYVDKTAYFHRLITHPSAHYFFLSRPRRFGKSLMITTLKAIFQGRRDLFADCAIAKTDYDWKVSPVIHLDMSFCAAAQCEDFACSLPVEVERALGEAGYAYDRALKPRDNFARAIDYFYAQGTPCVVLIDEYDDPVAKALKDVAEAEKVRDALSMVYGQLKGRTNKVRFLMFTGVSKFTKMSVFSTISNLVDISFNDDYAAMLGYTEAELDANFGAHMAAHAAKMGLAMPAYRAELRRLYNGYRFWLAHGENVYNPVSINLTLANGACAFQSYWADTGRPSMLMRFLQRGEVVALDPECVRNVGKDDFDVADLAHLRAVPMLYQTGYLTIKDYNPCAQTWTLGVPDEEVRQDMALLMTSQMAGEDVAWASSIGKKFLGCDWDGFFAGLKALYAAAPYGSTEGRVHESSYTRNLLFLLKGQGIVCHGEVVEADGRIDLVAEHPCGTYIFELKVDKSAAIAMSQMVRKEYAASYAAAEKPVWFIGLAFDSKTRTISDCCAMRAA